MIKFKIDIMEELKKRGYNPLRIKQENIIGQKTVQDIRHGKVTISMIVLDRLCKLLELQPADILMYISDDGSEDKADQVVEK